MRRRDWLGALAGLCVLPAAAAPMAREQQHLFGSPVALLLPHEVPRALRDEAWRRLADIHRRWNAWKPGDVMALNAAFRDGRSARTTPALIALLRGAAELEQRSGGHFNAALGGLVGSWGFHDDVLRPGALPPARELARWTDARPSLSQLEIRGQEVRSRNPFVRLDFGGYAKGVAIDLVLARLRAQGVRDALLNLGGNLGAIGQAGARPWSVGVRDPQGAGLLATLDVVGAEAVVTSGSYERSRLVDGRRVTHIIDPHTGWPAPELVSVTVVHRQAALADAAATALLVAGPRRWREVADRMGVDQVLVVDRGGRREATPALAARLRWQA